MDVIKEQGRNGKVIYKTKDGKEIETYSETLHSIVSCALERFGDLFDLMTKELDENDISPADPGANIGEALIRDTQRLIDEFDNFVRKNLGDVEVDITRGLYPEMVGVRLEPVKKF